MNLASWWHYRKYGIKIQSYDWSLRMVGLIQMIIFANIFGKLSVKIFKVGQEKSLKRYNHSMYVSVY